MSRMSNKKEISIVEVYNNVRSCILSSKNCTIPELLGTYKGIVGTLIPFKNLGFNNIEHFLQSVPGLKCKQGVLSVVTEGTEHIQALVSKQKTNSQQQLKKQRAPNAQRYKNVNFTAPRNLPPRFSKNNITAANTTSSRPIVHQAATTTTASNNNRPAATATAGNSVGDSSYKYNGQKNENSYNYAPRNSPSNDTQVYTNTTSNCRGGVYDSGNIMQTAQVPVPPASNVVYATHPLSTQQQQYQYNNYGMSNFCSSYSQMNLSSPGIAPRHYQDEYNSSQYYQYQPVSDGRNQSLDHIVSANNSFYDQCHSTVAVNSPYVNGNVRVEERQIISTEAEPYRGNSPVATQEKCSTQLHTMQNNLNSTNVYPIEEKNYYYDGLNDVMKVTPPPGFSPNQIMKNTANFLNHEPDSYMAEKHALPTLHDLGPKFSDLQQHENKPENLHRNESKCNSQISLPTRKRSIQSYFELSCPINDIDYTCLDNFTLMGDIYLLKFTCYIGRVRTHDDYVYADFSIKRCISLLEDPSSKFQENVLILIGATDFLKYEEKLDIKEFTRDMTKIFNMLHEKNVKNVVIVTLPPIFPIISSDTIWANMHIYRDWLLKQNGRNKRFICDIWEGYVTDDEKVYKGKFDDYTISPEFYKFQVHLWNACGMDTFGKILKDMIL